MFLQKFKQIAENYMEDSKKFIVSVNARYSSSWIVLLLKKPIEVEFT